MDRNVPANPPVSNIDALRIARNLILEPSGLDDTRLDRLFGEVLAHSVDFADLYFQLAHEEAQNVRNVSGSRRKKVFMNGGVTSALAAIMGAFVGGFASLASTFTRKRSPDRRGRRVSTRRAGRFRIRRRCRARPARSSIPTTTASPIGSVHPTAR